MRYPTGTRVTFNADLGTILADGSTPAGIFTDVIAYAGEAGTVVDVPVPADLVSLGWFYVKPDKDDRLLVPVTDGFFELES